MEMGFLIRRRRKKQTFTEQAKNSGGLICIYGEDDMDHSQHSSPEVN